MLAGLTAVYIFLVFLGVLAIIVIARSTLRKMDYRKPFEETQGAFIEGLGWLAVVLLSQIFFATMFVTFIFRMD